MVSWGQMVAGYFQETRSPNLEQEARGNAFAAPRPRQPGLGKTSSQPLAPLQFQSLNTEYLNSPRLRQPLLLRAVKLSSLEQLRY